MSNPETDTITTTGDDRQWTETGDIRDIPEDEVFGGYILRMDGGRGVGVRVVPANSDDPISREDGEAEGIVLRLVSPYTDGAAPITSWIEDGERVTEVCMSRAAAKLAAVFLWPFASAEPGTPFRQLLDEVRAMLPPEEGDPT